MHKRLFGILASVAIIAAACGGASSSSAPPASTALASGQASTPPAGGGDLADEQVLRLYLGPEDPASLDPSLAETSESIAVLHSVHRGLVYFDKDLNIVPALAEKWDISADAKTYTFTLKDAKYSNDDPIVAADLVYAWKRVLDPRTLAPYQSFYGSVAGAQALIDLAGKEPPATDAEVDAALANLGVAAPDDKTFVVTLANPTGYFLDIAALWGAAPFQEKWITSPNALEAANYVSSGPFKLKSWTHASEIVLEPNPNWYGEKPTLTEINYSIGGDPAASQLAFEAGEYDMVGPPPPDVPRIKADPVLGPLLQSIPALITDYWGFDTSKGPTGNKEFRLALTKAVDKDTMMATVYGGQGIVAGSPIAPGMPGHQPEIGLKYNVDEAKAHLATALKELGYSDVSQVPKLTFGFNTDAGHDIPAAYMQEQWRTNLGIETELIGTTFDQFVVDRPNLVYSLARNAWGADYPHPDNLLRGLFHSQSGNNDEGYNNPEFDRLVTEAGAELDVAKSLALYAQAQELLVQDAPAVFTRWRIQNYEVQPWVDGIIPTASDSENIGDYFFENVKILKH